MLLFSAIWASYRGLLCLNKSPFISLSYRSSIVCLDRFPPDYASPFLHSGLSPRNSIRSGFDTALDSASCLLNVALLRHGRPIGYMSRQFTLLSRLVFLIKCLLRRHDTISRRERPGDNITSPISPPLLIRVIRFDNCLRKYLFSRRIKVFAEVIRRRWQVGRNNSSSPDNKIYNQFR